MGSERAHRKERAAERGGLEPKALEAARGAARSEGQPLEPAARTYLEPRFGHSFANIRVHADGEADRLARDLEARAFTVGPDIVFRSGEYEPGSPEGIHLLAHELTHAVQQQSGLGLEGGRGRPGDAHERHADAVAGVVALGGFAQPVLGAGPPAGGSGAGLAVQCSEPGLWSGIRGVARSLYENTLAPFEHGYREAADTHPVLAVLNGLNQYNPVHVAAERFGVGYEEARGSNTALQVLNGVNEAINPVEYAADVGRAGLSEGRAAVDEVSRGGDAEEATRHAMNAALSGVSLVSMGAAGVRGVRGAAPSATRHARGPAEMRRAGIPTREVVPELPGGSTPAGPGPIERLIQGEIERVRPPVEGATPLNPADFPRTGPAPSAPRAPVSPPVDPRVARAAQAAERARQAAELDAVRHVPGPPGTVQRGAQMSGTGVNLGDSGPRVPGRRRR